MIRIRDLRVGYGQGAVLSGLSIELPAKGLVAVLGRNGAGKTTLLKTLSGLLRPEAGTIELDGVSIAGRAAWQIARMGVGYMPQEAEVFRTLSVRENLLLGGPESQWPTVLRHFPRLGERMQQRAGTLSGGERKMLGMARVLLARPRLMLLDEPTEGVWPGLVEEMADILQRLKRELAILLVEQHVPVALRVADYIYVLSGGQVVLEGAPEELASHKALYTYLTP